eukprot:scaffold12.g8261.t1
MHQQHRRTSSSGSAASLKRPPAGPALDTSAMATPRGAAPGAAAAGASPYPPPRTPGPSSVRGSARGSPGDDARSVGSDRSSGGGGSLRGVGRSPSGGALDAALAALPPPASTEEAVHAVPSLLSQLMTGRPEEQAAAARRLLSYCERCGTPVHSAVGAAGGVHMLLIMLDSLDRGVRDACVRLLAGLAANPRLLAEVEAAPGGLAAAVPPMFRALADGQPAAARFLGLLAAARSQAVRTACARARVVHVLTRAVAGGAARARVPALAALEAFCEEEVNVRKMGWAGGVEALLGALGGGGGGEELSLPALRLLDKATRALPEAAPTACTAAGVAALAQFVGSPAAPLEAQCLAAAVLARVAAVPVQRDDAGQALTDLVLPRAFEILHEYAQEREGLGEEEESAPGAGAGAGASASASEAGDADGGGAAAAEAAAARWQARLRGSAAAVVARLVARSPGCCHALLFHSALLRPALSALLASRQFALAQGLLQAAAEFARRPAAVPAY